MTAEKEVKKLPPTTTAQAEEKGKDKDKKDVKGKNNKDAPKEEELVSSNTNIAHIHFDLIHSFFFAIIKYAGYRFYFNPDDRSSKLSFSSPENLFDTSVCFIFS